jgi:hypothetical protein
MTAEGTVGAPTCFPMQPFIVIIIKECVKTVLVSGAQSNLLKNSQNWSIPYDLIF